VVNRQGCVIHPNDEAHSQAPLKRKVGVEASQQVVAREELRVCTAAKQSGG
jgi:hypothetical protein